MGISLTLHSLAAPAPGPCPAKLSLVTPPSLHHLLRPAPELGPEPEMRSYDNTIEREGKEFQSEFLQKLVFSLIDD